MTGTAAVNLMVQNWNVAVPGTVTKEQGEWLNAILINLLRRIEAAGVEMPSVAVISEGRWVNFGPRK